VSDYGRALGGMCRHCAAFGVVRLGVCPVCGEAVCEKCGDTHHVRGEKEVIHQACLSHDDSPFKMIRFVK
jgi:hypothetical protein